MKKIIVLHIFAFFYLFQCFSYDYKEINHIKCEKLTEENNNMISDDTLLFIKQQRQLSNEFSEITDFKFEIFMLYNELAVEDRIICALEKGVFDSTWYIIIHETLDKYSSRSGIRVIDTGILRLPEKNRKFAYLDSIVNNPDIPTTECDFMPESKIKKNNIVHVEFFLFIILLILSACNIFISIMINRRLKK